MPPRERHAALGHVPGRAAASAEVPGGAVASREQRMGFRQHPRHTWPGLAGSRVVAQPESTAAPRLKDAGPLHGVLHVTPISGTEPTGRGSPPLLPSALTHVTPASLVGNDRGSLATKGLRLWPRQRQLASPPRHNCCSGTGESKSPPCRLHPRPAAPAQQGFLQGNPSPLGTPGSSRNELCGADGP